MNRVFSCFYTFNFLQSLLTFVMFFFFFKLIHVNIIKLRITVTRIFGIYIFIFHEKDLYNKNDKNLCNITRISNLKP